MSKKIGLIVLALLVLSLSACQLSASTPPADTLNINQPQGSPTVVLGMSIIEQAGSQTAVALTGLPAFLITDATPTGTPLAGLPADTALPTPTTDPLAVSTPLPPQPTVQTVRPATYTLREGEFIFCLARRFDVDPDQTLSLNGLVDSETIYPGLTVKIPASGSFPGIRALKAHPATYTVRTGDSIYSIACLYGDVDPMNIAAVNGLAAPYTLTTGAQIQIP